MGTKRCGRCGCVKSVDEFHRRGKICQAWCKPCRREYDAAYFQLTRERRRDQKRERRARLAEWYRDLKAGRPCADCGGTFHYAAMVWDHVPGQGKEVEVSRLLMQGQSKRRILEEIARCELVCANCHAVRTVERLRGVAQPGRAPALGAGGFVGSNPTTPILEEHARPRGGSSRLRWLGVCVA
jgi:hypothetical protein